MERHDVARWLSGGRDDPHTLSHDHPAVVSTPTLISVLILKQSIFLSKDVTHCSIGTFQLAVLEYSKGFRTEVVLVPIELLHVPL